VTAVESGWAKHPDYRIDLVPVEGRAEAWFGDLLLAESTSVIRLEEINHVDRHYFPDADVRWELFTATDHHSICPFKGEADYWSLTAIGPVEENIVWAYRRPFPEVAGIAGYVCFYEERIRLVLNA